MYCKGGGLYVGEIEVSKAFKEAMLLQRALKLIILRIGAAFWLIKEHLLQTGITGVAFSNQL